MIGRNYYKVLGVARTAERAEIRAAYVRLVKHHHPDRVGCLPNRLGEVQSAYRCLSVNAKRRAHDQDLASWERAHRAHRRGVTKRLDRLDVRQLRKSLGPVAKRGAVVQVRRRHSSPKLKKLVILAAIAFVLSRLALVQIG